MKKQSYENHLTIKHEVYLSSTIYNETIEIKNIFELNPNQLNPTR